MARSTDDILEELRRNAPHWLDRGLGVYILRMIAAVLATVESYWEAWFDQAFRQTADEPFLEDHGADRGVERHPWEDTEEYRERACIKPKSPTPEHVHEHLNELLERDGWDAKIVEPHSQVLMPEGNDNPEMGFYAGTPTARPAPSDGYPRLFWVNLPLPELQSSQMGMYLVPEDADDPDLHDAYLGATPRSEARRCIRNISQALDELAPHGTAFGVTIEDRSDLALYDQLMGPGGPIAQG